MEVRRRDSRTGTRSCASSRVNVREDIWVCDYSSPFQRALLVVGKSSLPQSPLIATIKPLCRDSLRTSAISAIMVCQRPTTASLNFQHPSQRHLGPVLHIVANLDLV